MRIFRKGKLSQKEITQWLREMRKNCYAPESGFYATCVLRARLQGVDDYYFAGVNVENAEYRITTHAEEGAIASMVTGLGREAVIEECWVMGAPKKPTAKDKALLASSCGKCRQQIAELASKNAVMHAVSMKGKVSSTTVGKFLPNAFTFFVKRGGLDDSVSAPSIGAVQRRILRNSVKKQEIFPWLKELDSIDTISKVSQSLVLKLENGAFVAGAKVEDIAFDSMNAMQSAVAVAVSEFGALKVHEVWVYTRERRKQHSLSKNFGALTMSALQTLLEMTGGKDISINFFSGNGKVTRMSLFEAAKIAPVSGKPFHKSR